MHMCLICTSSEELFAFHAAIRKAFKRLYSLDDEEAHQTAVAELPSAATLTQVAEPWRPYRTVGSWYMWHVVETKEAAYTFGL
eukprot:SAG31_NODE_108_length_24741_cov_6.933041_2_plen_83_part_00